MENEENIKRIAELESHLECPNLSDGKRLDTLDELWRCYWSVNPRKSGEVKRKIDFYFYDKAIAAGNIDWAIENLESKYFNRQARAGYTEAGDRCKEIELEEIAELLLPLADKNQKLKEVYKKAKEEGSFGLKLNIARYLSRRDRTQEMESLFGEFENEQDRAFLVRMLS